MGTRHHWWKLLKHPIRIGCDRSQVSSFFPAPSPLTSPDNKLLFELTRGSFIEHGRLAFGRNYQRIQSEWVVIGLICFPFPSTSPSLDNQVSFELARRPFTNMGVWLPSAETTEGSSQSVVMDFVYFPCSFLITVPRQ